MSSNLGGGGGGSEDSTAILDLYTETPATFSSSSDKSNLGMAGGREEDGDDDVVLSGNIAGLPGDSSSSLGMGSSRMMMMNTLDEPIRDTIYRDSKAVASKFYHVLYPLGPSSATLLKEWDLWGPLILCTLMATLLQSHDENEDNKEEGGGGDGGPQFAEVFVIVWLGSMIVTLNTKLLGGNISFFQSVCVLGYCLLPLAMSLVICRIILILGSFTTTSFIFRASAVLIGFTWSIFASIQFLGECQPKTRKALAIYPIFLFYFIISWIVISHSG